MSTQAAHWTLFNDWCSATFRDVDDVRARDVLDFVRQVPAAPTVLRRRLTAIANTLGWDHLGFTDEWCQQFGIRRPGEPVDGPAWRGDRSLPVGRDPIWLSLHEALSRCPTSGWPRGIRGRRDAALLVLLAPRSQGGVGLPRAAAVALRPRDITLAPAADGGLGSITVAGVTVGHADRADQCPTCAIGRWLTILGAITDYRHGSVREWLVKARDHVDEHLCAQLERIRPGWRDALLVLTRISATGLAEVHSLDAYNRIPQKGLTVRTAHSILEARTPRTTPLVEELEDEPDPWADLDDDRDETPDRPRRPDDEVYAEADEVNARIAAMLAESEAIVAATSVAAK